jgi:hypothetical protein
VAASILARIHPASIRAVCYQLFTAGWLDSMAKKDTNRVSTLLTWAREHDDIPWAWIVDETRAPERISAWADPAAYAETVSRAYRRDRWTDQPSWIEVWSEKGTIRGTLAPVLNRYGVTFRVLHGYGSATALHEAADESWTDERDRELRVLYCGDWDPSGLHMSEVDLPARLEAYDANITIQRRANAATHDMPGLSGTTASAAGSSTRLIRTCCASACGRRLTGVSIMRRGNARRWPSAPNGTRSCRS